MAKCSVPNAVLITGYSDGGLGAALAAAFHDAGFHVYAAARNPSKMAHLSSLGTETHTLDVLSDTFISAYTKQVPILDILVHNAGAGYSMPFSDLAIPEAKKIFDLNLWSYVAVAQAFLPLLPKSKGMLVNNTSVESVSSVPFKSVYAASKAAMAVFSECQRLELQRFGITVMELKTAAIRFPCQKARSMNLQKEAVEVALRHEKHAGGGIPADEWAAAVVQDLVKTKSPLAIWRESSASFAWFGTFLPRGMLDRMIKKVAGIDVLEQKLSK